MHIVVIFGRETPPPPIDHRLMQDHYTDYISHIDVCKDTSADRPNPPPPINHRSMEDHYTSAQRPHPFLQLSIDLWKTTALQQFHGRLTPPPPPNSNRSMQDHYTDYISHIDICRDTTGDQPHPLIQLTIDLWQTTAQLCCTYCRMHNNQCRQTPPPCSN